MSCQSLKLDDSLFIRVSNCNILHNYRCRLKRSNQIEYNPSAHNHATSATTKYASLPTHILTLHKQNDNHNNDVAIYLLLGPKDSGVMPIRLLIGFAHLLISSSLNRIVLQAALLPSTRDSERIGTRSI